MFGCTSKTLAQDSWAVYIYMCGSDLESEQGMASKNLASLQSVPLPDNVRFFIQTGGAHAWHTEGIPSEALGRFVYDSKGFHKVAELEQASMAEEKTFEDFLRYAKDNYPADHRMLIFWDHACRLISYRNHSFNFFCLKSSKFQHIFFGIFINFFIA